MGKPKKHQEVFYFNRKERLGLLLLSLLIVFTAYFRTNWIQKPQAPLTLQWEILPVPKIDSSDQALIPTPDIQAFNPNTIQEEKLLSYGVPRKAVTNWLRYREKGGQFRKVEDVKRIYSLPSKTYHRIKPFLRFPNQKKKIHPTPKWASNKPKTKKKQLTPFPFDPNKANFSELQQLGLSTKTTQQIINYREHGGQFRVKADLQKIYSLSKEEFEALEPYIRIGESPKPKKEHTYSLISINTPHKKEWQQFRGIGPTYAQRIIAYGKKLGGYHNTEQLFEVWGIPDSVIQQTRPFLEVSGALAPISASDASYQTLVQHPYLRSKQVKLIIRFREAHEGQISWKDIQDLPCFTKHELDRLAPYILEAQWP